MRPLANGDGVSSYESGSDMEEVVRRNNSQEPFFSDEAESGLQGAMSSSSSSPQEEITVKFADRFGSPISSHHHQLPNKNGSASKIHSGTETCLNNGSGIDVQIRGLPRRASEPKTLYRRGGKVSSHSDHRLSPQSGALQMESTSCGFQKINVKVPKSHQKQKCGHDRPPEDGPIPSLSKQFPLEHASSLDHMRGRVGGGCGLVEVKMATSDSGRSNSMHETSPHVMKISKQQSHGGLSGNSTGVGGGTDLDNVIVRKLFPQLSLPPQSSHSTTSVSSSIPTLFCAPQTQRMDQSDLFSTSYPASAKRIPHGSVLNQHSKDNQSRLVPALSLDEIERKMTEESREPLSYHSSKEPSQPILTAGVSKGRAEVPQAAPLSSGSSEGDRLLLLQPSVFTVPSLATPYPSSTSSAVSSSSMLPLLLPSVAANVAAITVEPPGCVVVENKGISNSSSNSTPALFPCIPPIMHAAGMTAPPLTKTPFLATPTNAKSTVHRQEMMKAKELITHNNAIAMRDGCQAMPTVHRADTTPYKSPIPNPPVSYT